ncbi:MAG: DUF2326 domain-containing protein [Cetobacterium sp.]
MLREIQSDFLIENKIELFAGLNIVLGDSKASNSIGKSTFLMIIDLIFGGESYLKKNTDVFEAIKEHEFNFKFEFENEKYYFKKRIQEKGQQKTYICNENYKIVLEITTDKYERFLKEKYKIIGENTTFRQIVSLYSRIWGKENYNPKKPLDLHPKENEKTAIDRLLKVYDKYNLILDKEKQKKELEFRDKALKNSFKTEIINKITKREYEKNIKKLEALNKEKEDFFENPIRKIIDNNETKNLSEEYSNLIKKEKGFRIQVLKIDSKIDLLSSKKNGKNNLKSDEIEKIIEFFPNINIEKLEEVEKFHNKITKYVEKEINEELEELKKEKLILEDELILIQIEIENIIEELGIGKSQLVEKIMNLANEITRIEKDNKYYEESKELAVEKIDVNDNLNQIKIKMVDEVVQTLNFKMKEVNKKIYEEHDSPLLKANEKNYEFGITNNKGTGRSYESIIVLDISVLESSQLPLIIHDSFLFKNLAVDLMENIIKEYYVNNSKQIFISLDEIQRYKDDVIDIIEECKVLKLDKNRYLFKKNWGK